MRSRGRCSGSGRRAGLRRSNAATLTAALAAAAAIRAAASACPASSSRSANSSSSCSSSTPRSADWPKRSWRSFLIVNLSFSISTARYCASLCAASRAARSATSIDCNVATSLGSESSMLIADERITERSACLTQRSGVDSKCRDQPAACGRQVCCGRRQSIPSSK